MRTPNDKKRPNTNGSAETRNRQRNFKYVHVSKKIQYVPVLDENGQPTGLSQLGVEKKGTTYRKPK